jgi:hypothetical protein
VGSSLPRRLFETCKAAGRPLPRFSDDDVLDYIVAEAVVAKSGVEMQKESEQQQKQKEAAEWRRGKGDSRPMPQLEYEVL